MNYVLNPEISSLLCALSLGQIKHSARWMQVLKARNCPEGSMKLQVQAGWPMIHMGSALAAFAALILNVQALKRSLEGTVTRKCSEEEFISWMRGGGDYLSG